MDGEGRHAWQVLTLLGAVAAVCFSTAYQRQEARKEYNALRTAISGLLAETRKIKEQLGAAHGPQQPLPAALPAGPRLAAAPPAPRHPAAPPKPPGPPLPPLPPPISSLAARKVREVILTQCIPSAEQPVTISDPALDELAQASSTHGGMAPSQYRLVMREVLRRRPTSMLVFSVGSDTQIWNKLNAGGRTVFVEDSPEWAAKVRKVVPAADIRLVNYTSDPLMCIHNARDIVGDDEAKARAVRDRYDLTGLRRELWGDEWRLIHIDGPSGFLRGRLQPVLLAVWLGCDTVARKGGTVSIFLHDVERKCEAELALAFFRGHVADCQAWPKGETTALGSVPASTHITMQRYELNAQHPICSKLQLPAPTVVDGATP